MSDEEENPTFNPAIADAYEVAKIYGILGSPMEKGGGLTPHDRVDLMRLSWEIVQEHKVRPGLPGHGLWHTYPVTADDIATEVDKALGKKLKKMPKG
jgi:hypothetical protein